MTGVTTGDVTPAGDPVDTVTMWLTFPDGEAGLSVDLTGFNAAMRRLREQRGDTESNGAAGQ